MRQVRVEVGSRKIRVIGIAVFFVFLLVSAIAVVHAESYIFVLKWGSYGSGDGQFGSSFTPYSPYGVAVDNSGNVYVVDSDNCRVQKFDSSGNFLLKWGSNGTGNGQFYFPSGVAVDSSGNVYVTDTGVQKFNSNGVFITKWGSTGSGDGQFMGSWGIAVDSSGNVYVTDDGNNRVQKFDSAGNYLTQWGSGGSGDGQFSIPYGVAIDSSGNVYVSDSGNFRVQKFVSSTVIPEMPSAITTIAFLSMIAVVVGVAGKRFRLKLH